MRKDEEEAVEATVAVECAVDRAGDVEGTVVEAEGLSREAFAGSSWVGGVSPEECGLFLPEGMGDGGEGRLGILKSEGRGPQTCDHLLTVEFCGDGGREQRLDSPG